MITAIQRGDKFYSRNRFGGRIGVVIATHLGHKYIKTEIDDLQPDNLLAKPDRQPS